MNLLDEALKLSALREQEAARAAARAAALDNAMRLGLADAGVSDPADQALLAAPNVRALSPAEQAQLPGVASGQFAPDANSYRQQAIAQMARDQLGQSFALADAGLDEHKLAQARDEQARTANFLQVAEALRAARASGKPVSGWDVLSGNFANKLRLESPVDVQGDTVINRYDTAAPVLSTTPLGQARIGAEQALGTYRTAAAGDETAQARLHGAQAEQAEMLAQARAKLLANPDAPELLKLDALGGNHQLFKGSLVKVRQKDGTEVYMRETPNVSGGFDYTPAVGPGNEPLLVPALGGGERKTALERNAQLLADTYNLPFEDALTLARQGKGQTDAQIAQARWKAAWTEAGKDYRAMGNPDQQRALAAERYRAAWGTEPPMELIQGGNGTPSRSGQGQSARGSGAPAQAAGGQPAAGRAAMPPEAATLIAQANAAIARGKDKNAVQARLRAMLRELGVDPTAVGY